MNRTITGILTESSCLVSQIEKPYTLVDRVEANANNDGIAYLSCAVEGCRLACRARVENGTGSHPIVLLMGDSNLNLDDCQINKG